MILYCKNFKAISIMQKKINNNYKCFNLCTLKEIIKRNLSHLWKKFNLRHLVVLIYPKLEKISEGYQDFEVRIKEKV